MKLIVCKGYRILCFKNNFVDCQERVGLRCYWSYGLGLGLGLEPCGLVNITGFVFTQLLMLATSSGEGLCMGLMSVRLSVCPVDR